MNVRNSRLGMWAAVSITACGVFPSKAELPGLDDRQWVGHFLGLETKDFHFGVTTKGKGVLLPVGKKGDPVSPRLGLGFDFVVLETLPDGKIVAKPLRPETLESADPASSKFTSATFRGKVAGDAGFEVTLNNDRGRIALGGKLLDPGTLKNPLKFAIRVNFPNGYPHDTGKPEGKKAEKAFEDKTKNDRLELKWADGKNVKVSLGETADASSKEITGPGIVALSYEVSSHQGKTVECIASDGSSFRLSNSAGKALNEGFDAIWPTDPVKDPSGRARLSILVE